MFFKRLPFTIDVEILFLITVIYIPKYKNVSKNIEILKSIKKLLDKVGKCYDFVSELILLFFQKNFKWHWHQDRKKVTTILMHHSKSQFWGKNKKMKKMNFAQNSFFLFVFQACKILFA